MYYIDIKDALHFMVTCVVVLEILGKMACFYSQQITYTCKHFYYISVTPLNHLNIPWLHESVVDMGKGFKLKHRTVHDRKDCKEG